MFAKPGHHLLPPERIEEWRRRGALPFFHYADNAERELNFAFYEDSLRYDAFNAAIASAGADLSGAARRVGRLPDGRGVRADAAERHAVAARRRSSADREPAADLERRRARSSGSTMSDSRLAHRGRARDRVRGSGFRVQRSVRGSGSGVTDAERANAEPRTLNREPCASAC